MENTLNELSIFEIEHNNLIDDFKKGVKDPLTYCSSALSRIKENSTNRRAVADMISHEESLLLETEKKMYSIKYAYFSLIASYYLKWDLNEISKLDFIQQHILLTAFLANLNLPEIPDKISNVEDAQEIMAYSIFHRWVLKIFCADIMPFRSNIDGVNSENPIYILAEKTASYAQKSIEILSYFIDKSNSFFLPFPNIDMALKEISHCLVTVENTRVNKFAAIDEFFEISPSELNSLILCDFCAYYFFLEKYNESKSFGILAIEFYNSALKPLNSMDLEILESYIKICSDVSEKNHATSQDFQFGLSYVLKEIMKNGLIPIELYSNISSFDESIIKNFIEECTFHLKQNINYELVSTILKLICLYTPQHTKLIEQSTKMDFTNCTHEWNGWETQPISFLSSISFSEPIDSMVEQKFRLIQLEQDLMHSQSFAHIQSTINQLHAIDSTISYAKRNLLYMTSLEPFISTIDDPFLFDLSNVVFSKVQQYKSLHDYKIIRDLLEGFFDYINNHMRPNFSVPYFLQLHSIIVDETLINSIVISRFNNEWSSSVLAQCRQFVLNFPTGSFIQNETVIHAVAELCNLPDFNFFASLTNTQNDSKSLKRFVYLLSFLWDSINTKTKPPDEIDDIWLLLLYVINDAIGAFSFNKKTMIDFIKKLTNPMVIDLISSLFIEIMNKYYEIKMEPLYFIIFYPTESTLVDLNSLLNIMEELALHMLKLDFNNNQWLRFQSDLLLCKKEYRQALIKYISLTINLNSINIADDRLMWCDQVIKNMMICCEKIEHFNTGLLIHCMLKNEDFELGRKFIDLSFENNQNIIDYIKFITDLDILECISELYCSCDNTVSLKKINNRIKQLSDLTQAPNSPQLNFQILEILLNLYIKN